MEILKVKNQSLIKELEVSNSSKTTKSVIVEVLQNNIKGHEYAIFELEQRIDWHHKINSSLVSAILNET